MLTVLEPTLVQVVAWRIQYTTDDHVTSSFSSKIWKVGKKALKDASFALVPCGLGTACYL